MTPPPLVTTADRITPDWLADALLASYDQRPAIESVDLSPIGQGQLAATFLITPTYAEDGATFPARVVVKLPAEDRNSRAFAQSLGCYTREVAFYREAADQLAVRTPQCFAAAVSDDGSDFVLLLEDLSPAREVGQVAGCDAAQAASALTQAAALHASSWADPHLAGATWLLSGRGVWQHVTANAPVAAKAFRERYAGHLDGATATVANAMDDGVAMRWVEQALRPRCVWHSDFRLDNLLFDGCGGEVPLAVVDWQSVTWADGTIDASYFLGAGLPTGVRREHEEALMRGYHAALIDGGVTDYSWDECWSDYRAHAIAGFLVATTAAVGTQPSPEADALFTTMASRHAQHMLDHGTLDLLDGRA